MKEFRNIVVIPELFSEPNGNFFLEIKCHSLVQFIYLFIQSFVKLAFFYTPLLWDLWESTPYKLWNWVTNWEPLNHGQKSYSTVPVWCRIPWEEGRDERSGYHVQTPGTHSLGRSRRKRSRRRARRISARSAIIVKRLSFKLSSITVESGDNLK